MDSDLWSSVKVVLAFLTRSSALVVLGLLFAKFARAHGPYARAFKQAFGSLCFLLIWVWVASVAELVRFMQGASVAIELGANYIFIPNLIITVWLARLLWVLRDTERGDDHGQ